jgi:polar amino acid transport system substrate-binding protein
VGGGRTGVKIRTGAKTAAIAGLALALASGCTSGGGSTTAARVVPPTAASFFSIAPPMNSSSGSQTCNPSAASMAPTSSAASGSDVAAILHKGYLTVGVAADQYLTGYLGGNGQEQGFDIDLADAIAQSLFGNGYQSRLRLVAISTDNRIPDLQNHKVDLVIDTMTITCQRLTEVDFSAVYYNASQRLLVQSGSGISSLADLAGKKVCAQTGSTSIALIQTATTSPKPLAIETTDISDCLVLLQEGQVSAISTDDTILAGLAKQDPNLEVVGPQLAPEPYGVAMRLGETDLEEYVNGVLAQYEADGGWQASYNHWLAPSLKAATPPIAQYSD